MADIETIGILDEIQSIISDRLQVVSYKWLSRKFLVSSNVSKRLLQEFVEKHGDGLEVVFSLSGWLKNKPSTYHIMLVSKDLLAGAKQEFEGNCSVQVYSVQACLPKDPATLWNHEFVQAEDLFKQPLTVDNCLRDNRFCGVSNSSVKRNSGETPLGTASQQAKTTGVSGLSKSSLHLTAGIPQPQQKKVQHSIPIVRAQSPDIVKNVKSESHVKLEGEQGAQLVACKEKVPHNKKKDQSDKNSSGTGGSLASMWGCASAKSKLDVPLALDNNSIQKSAASAEAQTCVREAVDYGSSDEDDRDFNIKRTSNGDGSRKRRVVFDYSDEEGEYQDAVSLASPDPPKKSILASKHFLNASGPGSNLSFEKENKPKMKEVKEADVEPNQQLGDKVSVFCVDKKAESSMSEKSLSHVPGMDASTKDKVADAGPKRRKVLKTRIDERGREVTEVVWEGDEADTKSDSNSVKKVEDHAVNNSTNRPPVARKSPVMGSGAPANQAGKAGNRKATNKDPKQGNILSFFKKA